MARTNTQLTKVLDSEFPMYSCTLRTYLFLSSLASMTFANLHQIKSNLVESQYHKH